MEYNLLRLTVNYPLRVDGIKCRRGKHNSNQYGSRKSTWDAKYFITISFRDTLPRVFTEIGAIPVKETSFKQIFDTYDENVI